MILLTLLLGCLLTIAAGDGHCDESDRTCDSQKTTNLYAVSGILNELFDVATKYSTDLDDFKVLSGLIETVKSFQSSSEDYLPRRESYEEAIPALQKYMEEKFPFSGVRMRVYPGMGVGIEATEDLDIDFQVSNISVKHVLSSQQSELKFACLGEIKFDNSKYPGLWHCLNLTILLLQHSYSDTSAFRPYINMLPKEAAHPIFFTYDEMAALRHSVVLEGSLNTVQEMAAMYSKIYRALKANPKCATKLGLPIEKFTFKAFQWAYAIVLSRNYDGSFIDGQRNKVLLPFWDLFNHKLDADLDTYNEWRQEEDHYPARPLGTYVTYTLKPIKKGQQLFMHYLSLLDPVEAFSTWGFVEYNEITIPFRTNNLTGGQKTIAYDTDWVADEFTLKNPSQNPRLIDAKILLDAIDIVASKRYAPMTPKRLQKAWEMIRAQVVDHLTTYKHTLEDYRELLETEGISTNQRLIYQNYLAEIGLLTAIKDYISNDILT